MGKVDPHQNAASVGWQKGKAVLGHLIKKGVWECKIVGGNLEISPPRGGGGKLDERIGVYQGRT